MKIFITQLSCILFIALTSACGGGGSKEAPAPVVNSPPIANAGVNQIVKGFSEVTLSGSGTDSDGIISTYLWAQKSGTQVTLTNSSAAITNFTSPNAAADEVLIFSLTVTDNQGATHSDDINITVTNRSEFLWSEELAWGGTLPAANDPVTIPEGITLTLDISPPTLGDIIVAGTLVFGQQSVSLTANSMLVEGSLLVGSETQASDNQANLTFLEGMTIEGTSVFGQQNISLTADWIMVNGSFQIGSENTPYTKQAVITLTGDSTQNIMDMGSRGLFVMSGNLELHGNPPQTAWTKITQHIEADANQFTVLDAQGWKSGDKIVLAPTDFYDVGSTQLLTLETINSLNITVLESIQKFHWGLMQYATTTGMSLTQNSPVTPPAPPEEGATPLELDERAEVGNLSRNIIIQSTDDLAWQNNAFGAQMMIMGLDSVVHVNGVEFRRSGQAGLLGRYPIHWHRLSYPGGISEIGDANGHYVKNSAIHNSANRCITIHATNGVRLENNICYDIIGHGIFFEDAVERRNIVENNLILGIRNPTVENTLLLHERHTSDIISGSSGIWVTNPDNTVRNNVLADSEGFGLWMAFPETPQGVSKAVPLVPNSLPLGDFDSNIMHSNKGRGVMLDNPPVDDEGNVFPLDYAAQTAQDDPSCPRANRKSVNIKGWKLWKNGGGNFWNRVICANYEEFVSADSEGKYFAGGGKSGKITRALIVGTSLNNASPQPHDWVGPPTALATYHSAFSSFDNVIINFPIVQGKTSGAFATDDYYVRPVEKGMINNTNNLLINSHGGYRSDAAVNEEIVFNFAQGHTHFVFAGALLDPQGLWGKPDNWNLYDKPFLTHNLNCDDIMPSGMPVKSCTGTFFGVRAFVLDQANDINLPKMEIDVIRYNKDSPNIVVGNWHIDGEEQEETLLIQMRHFAAADGGIYQLDFPSSTIPEDVSVDITNMHDDSNSFILAIRFKGSQPANVYSSTRYDFFNEAHANSETSSIKHNYQELDSRQAVIDSSGETFWQDSANNLVWIKITPNGIEQNDPSLLDAPLYNPFHLRVW